MQRTLFSLAVLLSISMICAAEPAKGIKPRSKAQSYPAVVEQQKLALGAARLSEKQVRKTFVSSLGKKYVVVEVGAFPKSALELSPQDFMLVVRGQKDVIRPADPNEIAAKLAKKEQVDNDITVTPVAGVTYSSGSDRYDPSMPPHGWSTTSGVMVDTGGHRRSPKTVQGDRKTMVAELTDKQLPTGKTGKAVAGYLYFPVPENKNAALDLEYQGTDGQMSVQLATPSQ